MRTSCTIGLLLVLVASQSALAYQVMLSPVDDAQCDRATLSSPVVLTNPPSYGILMSHNVSTTGELHAGILEYSLASLPGNAIVTSASFTYEVNLVSTSGDSRPILECVLYDGVDGQVTIDDAYKSPFFWVAASGGLASPGIYTTDFSDISELNNRATNFPSGYVGLGIVNSVEAVQARIWSAEDAQAYGFQAPVITITYMVPEPGGLALLIAAGAVLLIWRRKRGRG